MTPLAPKAFFCTILVQSGPNPEAAYFVVLGEGQSLSGNNLLSTTKNK